MHPRASARRSTILLLVAVALLGACTSESPTGAPAARPDPGSIAGRVVHAASGEPVAGAAVRTNLSAASVSSGADGHYRIDGVVPGSYAVTATRDGFQPAVATVAVEARTTATLDLALAPSPAAAIPGGSVTGRVLRRDGRLVGAGVVVEIAERAEGCEGVPVASSSTDALGRFVARELAPGDYVACVRAPLEGGAFGGTVGFAIRGGDLAEADLTLERLVGSGPIGQIGGNAVVTLGERVSFTFTIVSDGEGGSTDVIVTDTLPLLDDPAGPPGPRDRDGNQAFRYVTDRPTFDPDAIRYYVDLDDDAGGTATDVCFQAPAAALPAAFLTPRAAARCGGSFTGFATIAEAREAAQAASRDGDQIVAIQYFDADILDRTAPGGDVEAEDAFEVTLEAIHSVNEFRLPGGAIPALGDENGCWCNVVTAISAENDHVAKVACTRVVEALLEVRKTVSDALVAAGSQTEFLVEIGNSGSSPLEDVVVSDTLDAAFLTPATGDPGLVMEEDLCAGCTLELGPDSTVITIRVPSVPPTDADGDGAFDDAEGFTVVNLVTRLPLRAGTFCNRVTVRDDAGRSDTDLACAVTRLEVELDVVNEDGLLTGAGEFQDVETFRVGDSVAYRTAITNRSAAAASSVSVLWEVAPGSSILDLVRVLDAGPATIGCSTLSDTCAVELGTLAPGASVTLNYLTLARTAGTDVNRIRLAAAELSLPVVNEEPTTVRP